MVIESEIEQLNPTIGQIADEAESYYNFIISLSKGENYNMPMYTDIHSKNIEGSAELIKKYNKFNFDLVSSMEKVGLERDDVESFFQMVFNKSESSEYRDIDFLAVILNKIKDVYSIMKDIRDDSGEAVYGDSDLGVVLEIGDHHE